MFKNSLINEDKTKEMFKGKFECQKDIHLKTLNK